MVKKEMEKGKKRKSKLPSGLLFLFFAMMLIGSFFHQAIDEALFQVKIKAVKPESYLERQEETVVIDGEEVSAWKYSSFWRLPSEAVCDGSVFVLEEVRTAYGEYNIVRRRNVEIVAEEEDSVLISEGLTGKERVVVAASEVELEDGMRVALRK